MVEFILILYLDKDLMVMFYKQQVSKLQIRVLGNKLLKK